MKKITLLICLIISISNSFSQIFSATETFIATTENLTMTDWGRGFAFTPNVDINVTELGLRVPPPANSAFVWKIWESSTQTLIHSQACTGAVAGVYVYEQISTPLILTAGVEYIITLYGDISGYYWDSSSQINSNLTFGGMRYCNSCYTTQSFPSSNLGNYHYGTVDFLFTICDLLTISTTPSTSVCPGTPITLTASSINGGNISWDNGVTNGVPFTPTATTTYTATSDNSSDCDVVVTITVVDLAPVPDVGTLVDLTDECTVTAPTAPTATDDCSGIITGTTSTIFPISTQGTTVVTWTYDDGNGNVSTQNQNVIISDVLAPVADIATLSDLTDECSVTALTPPTATDNCFGSITGTTTTTLPITTQGTTVVTWTYDDGNGNTSTQIQNIVITDVTDPTIVCPNDTIVCDSIVNYITPIGLDNCSGQSTLLSYGLGSGSSFALGVTTEEYTVTDIAGNTATCSFTITVTTPPTINLGPDSTICQWDTIILDAGSFDTFLWSNGATTQTISIDSLGHGLGTHAFSVIAIDSNGCEAIDTISITIETCTGIAGNVEQDLINIYPNPSPGVYIISTKMPFNFTISDISGKEIYDGKIDSNESQIDISNQAQGIYLITFVNEDYNVTLKLLKR